MKTSDKNFENEKSVRWLLIDLMTQIDNSSENEKRHELFKNLQNLMSTLEFRTEVESILTKNELDSHSLMFVQNLVRAANMIYNFSDSETGLTDSEYDLLKEIYEKTTGLELSITESMNPTENVSKYTHYKDLRGTLSKIYKLTEKDILKSSSQESIDEWVARTEKIYKVLTGKSIDLWEEDVMIQPKFDGISAILSFDENGDLIQALTRGDVDTGEASDITHIIRLVMPKGPYVSKFRKYGLKTEAMIANEDLDLFNIEFSEERVGKNPYKNTRSAAASIINSLDANPEKAKYLKLIPLRIQFMSDDIEEPQEFPAGLYEFPFLKCKLKNLEEIREFAFTHKNVLANKTDGTFRCDGVVITLCDTELQKILGRQQDKNRYEVAFKYTEEVGYAKVKNINFTVGLLGRITPVVNFEGIKLKGNTVENAAISYKLFNKYHLAKGDVVKVSYDIIPYVMFDGSDKHCKRSGKSSIEFIKFCPECDSKLKESPDGGFVYCDNEGCPCRKKGKILNYLQKIGVEGISYQTVNDFYDLGYLKKIQDIYKLKKHVDDLVKIQGYGPESIGKILKSIDDHRTLTAATFLGALGIKTFSSKRFASLLEYMTYDELLEFALDKNPNVFIPLPKMGEKTAEILIDGICRNEKLILELEQELEILEEPRHTRKEYRVCFTKIRDKDLEKWIIDNDGEVADTLTKDTSILVVPKAGINSDKVEKAIKYNIPIVEIDKLKDYITDKYL